MVSDETLAALGEGRLTQAEVKLTVAEMSLDQRDALRTLFPQAYARHFCAGCGNPGNLIVNGRYCSPECIPRLLLQRPGGRFPKEIL